jgi:hypothetical protein
MGWGWKYGFTVIWTLTNLKFYHDLDIEKGLHVLDLDI